MSESKWTDSVLRFTVPRIQDLADSLGIDRRTLYTYRDAGMPIVEHPDGGYCFCPSLWWYSRMLQRRGVRKYLNQNRAFFKSRSPRFLENIEQLIEDHEKSWQDHIDKLVRDGTVD